MKTDHINYVDNAGQVYCYHIDQIVDLDADFFLEHCSECPYLYDTAGMMGVECVFDDGCNEKEIAFMDSAESEKHSKMQYKRLGLKTEKEVDKLLVGTVSGSES